MRNWLWLWLSTILLNAHGAFAQEEPSIAALRPPIDELPRQAPENAFKALRSQYPLLYTQIAPTAPALNLPAEPLLTTPLEQVESLPVTQRFSASSPPPASVSMKEDDAFTKPKMYRSTQRTEGYPKVANSSPTAVLQTVVVEQVQTGAPTWDEKFAVWKENGMTALRHTQFWKAQIWNDNVDYLKLKTKQAGPYVNTAAGVLSMIWNIKNINGSK